VGLTLLYPLRPFAWVGPDANALLPFPPCVASNSSFSPPYYSISPSHPSKPRSRKRADGHIQSAVGLSSFPPAPTDESRSKFQCAKQRLDESPWFPLPDHFPRRFFLVPRGKIPSDCFGAYVLPVPFPPFAWVCFSPPCRLSSKASF